MDLKEEPTLSVNGRIVPRKPSLSTLFQHQHQQQQQQQQQEQQHHYRQNHGDRDSLTMPPSANVANPDVHNIESLTRLVSTFPPHLFSFNPRPDTGTHTEATVGHDGGVHVSRPAPSEIHYNFTHNVHNGTSNVYQNSPGQPSLAETDGGQASPSRRRQWAALQALGRFAITPCVWWLILVIGLIVSLSGLVDHLAILFRGYRDDSTLGNPGTQQSQTEYTSFLPMLNASGLIEIDAVMFPLAELTTDWLIDEMPANSRTPADINEDGYPKSLVDIRDEITGLHNIQRKALTHFNQHIKEDAKEISQWIQDTKRVKALDLADLGYIAHRHSQRNMFETIRMWALGKDMLTKTKFSPGQDSHGRLHHPAVLRMEELLSRQSNLQLDGAYRLSAIGWIHMVDLLERLSSISKKTLSSVSDLNVYLLEFDKALEDDSSDKSSPSILARSKSFQKEILRYHHSAGRAQTSSQKNGIAAISKSMETTLVDICDIMKSYLKVVRGLGRFFVDMDEKITGQLQRARIHVQRCASDNYCNTVGLDQLGGLLEGLGMEIWTMLETIARG